MWILEERFSKMADCRARIIPAMMNAIIACVCLAYSEDDPHLSSPRHGRGSKARIDELEVTRLRKPTFPAAPWGRPCGTTPAQAWSEPLGRQVSPDRTRPGLKAAPTEMLAKRSASKPNWYWA